MIFLIRYNRKRGETVSLTRFDDAEKAVANRERLQLELRLNRESIDDEVVILQTDSEATLRRTHARYFQDFAGLSVLPAH